MYLHVLRSRTLGFGFGIVDLYMYLHEADVWAGIWVDKSLRVHVLTVKQTSGAEQVLLFLVFPPLLLLVLVYFLVIS